MKDAAYIRGLERFIIQALKPFRTVPMNLVYRAFGIKIPKGMKAKEITLADFIKNSKPNLKSQVAGDLTYRNKKIT